MTRNGPAVLALACLCLTAPPLAAQAGLDTVQIRTQRLAAGVHMLTGSGGNIGLSAGADGAFLVDDQYAPLTPKILAAIKSITDRPLRFVLNTHWHFDHTGGNENVGKAGALIVAHENVRVRMSTEQFIAALNRREPASPAVALPVVTFTEAVTFHLNGDSIRAIHVPPAHTDGDAIVHFTRANVLHLGDVFFNGRYPFVDVSSGGSFEGVISAVATALRMSNADTKIIPGHGALATRADLQTYHDVLAGVRDRIRPMIARGMTKEQVIAAKPTAQWDATWGTGFIGPDMFVGIVYESLKR